ncbi:MAG: nucleotidyltransferase [Acidobacteria bacterium]|nr:MAG: nucleotidyltransferase [Acidobacteriota bacterium]
MKAMVLAAGLGTRLRPLTDNRPKALVEVGGRALLEITLSRLRTFGISEVIVNVHHFADMVIDYLKSKKNLGMRIEVSREDVLLDTGGGLKKAAWFFLEDPSRLDEPFLLHNVDVISTIDFHRMLQVHTESHALATLAVQARQSSRLLLFNNQLQLRGRRAGGMANPGCATQITATQKEFVSKHENPQIAPDSASSQAGLPVAENVPSSTASVPEVSQDSSRSLHALAFCGIHIISPRLLPMIAEEGTFSIIPTYLRLSAQGRNILAFRADDYYWRDLGRPADLAEAAHDLKQRALRQ